MWQGKGVLLDRESVCGHNTKWMIQSVKRKVHCEIGKVFVDINYIPDSVYPNPGPQSRALCGNVCALSIAIVLY